MIRARPSCTSPFARAALTAALACSLAGCARERISSSERFVVASQPGPGEVRTVIEGGGAAPRSASMGRLGRRATAAWSGRALPLVSPDGARMAIESRSSVPWATRLGDPPPGDGIEAVVDVVSLDPRDAGVPLAAVRGPWILGRAASADGFPLERPRADGARDLAFAGWDGQVRTVAADGWCNAHAAAGEGGLLAWSRRAPEGGDWRLVVRRGDRTRVLDGEPGTSMLAPIPAGDGRGLFAVELRGSAASLAWIPFGADGLPDRRAAIGTASPRAPLSAAGNLGWVLRATDAAASGRGSAPGSGSLVLWNPDTARMVHWLPGSGPVDLLEGSVAALEAGGGNFLVTAGAGVFRERPGTGLAPALALDDAWVLHHLPNAPGRFLAIRPRPDEVEAAIATVGAEAADER